MDEMKEFVTKVRSIDPKATGSPLQTYEASLQMQKGYQQASIYALFVIVFLLFFDFRSIKDTFLALTPMLLGMAQTFGIMGLLGIPLNPANMIAIPLILGIGVDYGVHVIHDYRTQKGRYRLNPSTAGSVLITALTTITGFACLLIASHRGLQSLGRVLVIGMTCSVYCSVVLLPAILTWWTRNREEEIGETLSTSSAHTVQESAHDKTEVIESHFDRIHGIRSATYPFEPNCKESVPHQNEEYDSQVFSMYPPEKEQPDNPDDTSSTKTKRLKRRNVA